MHSFRGPIAFDEPNVRRRRQLDRLRDDIDLTDKDSSLRISLKAFNQTRTFVLWRVSVDADDAIADKPQLQSVDHIAMDSQDDQLVALRLSQFDPQLGERGLDLDDPGQPAHGR